MKRRELKQNNKGFSLVELIIVMAIMAILVGAIAPQVISYMEKSRESKDLQLVNTVYTSVNTILSSKDPVPASISDTLDAVTAAHSEIMDLLADDMDTVAEIKTKASSKKGKAGTLYVVYNNATGALSVYIGTAVGSPTIGPVTNQ